MHSKIFQIAKEPVNEGCYLQEDTLTQGDGSFYDYCTEIDDEERKKEIANLVKFILPKWKIQCKMPPKTKRFYPLVPK